MSYSGSSKGFSTAQICSNGLSCQVSQKGVLVATTHVDLKRKAITIRVLNLDNKPKTVDKGANFISTIDSYVGRFQYDSKQNKCKLSSTNQAISYTFASFKERGSLVKEMVDKGIIEESLGPLTSPIVLDMKKIGSTRFGFDYRKLNEITIKDSYPVPLIDDTLDALNGSMQCEDSMTAVPIGLANVAAWTVIKLNNGVGTQRVFSLHA
ncbi:hypothetical protein AVEN_271724-1 [Araneus ventricosus]|uniref:Uncharacterized protein n=1 Tax=Araneus ventricosus TaxID=182803 RepID=A0A4Y2V1D3_ARAVE|nr:hypothetical protein AVEN_238209-1 [Araneus ventricosus]GBO18331.1 hypothetical protein AVEN_271724-1 [Araneus ventricosus]